MSESVPMAVFHAEVQRVEDLSPGMRRVVFGGPGLSGYRSTGIGDEYVRLLFPVDQDGVPPLPKVVDDALDYDSIDPDRLRTYTVRGFEQAAGELSIDFVIHDGGVASSWARSARPGYVLGVNSPIGMYQPPPGLEWQILVADYAGLPAAARLLESTPPHVRSRVVLEVADQSHRISLPDNPNAEVTWVIGGNGHRPSVLRQVVESLPRPPGVGYVWVAGESRELRAVRRHLRRELGLPATAYKTVGYWIERAEEWRERFDALDETTRHEIDALWHSERDPEEIEDEYHERLTRLGL